MATITFHGAARTVTGSKYLIEANGESILIDCGMFQGEKRLRLLNWQAPDFDPADVSHVILTHTHIDHIGYLPRLLDHGFKGKVFATPATRALAKILLEDSAGIHEEDARYHRKHKLSKHKDPLPFYDRESARRAWNLIVETPRDQWVKISPTFSFRYQAAGHLLGAASIELVITERNKAGKKETRVLFSGDIGRYGMPFVKDPAPAMNCDYLILESTYGARRHAKTDALSAMAEVVEKIVASKGILLIPAFAIGRSQQIIYMLRVLMNEGRIPQIPITLDSPMAIDATDVYCKYEHEHGIPLEELEGPACVLSGPKVRFSAKVSDSKKLNDLRGPAIIISSSGMLTGGRVLHHLMRIAPVKENVILFAGYQAYGTRGRKMLGGDKTVRVYRRNIPVRAEIYDLDGMSGHGDAGELLHWSESITTSPKKIFLTHGEYDSAQALREILVNDRNWDVQIPDLGDSFEFE